MKIKIKTKKILACLLLAAMLLIMTAGCGSDGGSAANDGAGAADNNGGAGAEETPQSDPSPYVITSPYAGIDWAAYGQYKTALHVHTTNSDGSATLAATIEDHYSKDYDILAVTDHDFVTTNWVDTKNGITQERFDEIAAGADRNGRGMLQIPYTIEQSMGEHLNSFFAEFKNRRASMETSIEEVTALGGFSRTNHPGRYTGADRDWDDGIRISNDPDVIQRYVDLFMKYPDDVGMEIINKKDGESLSDRILWDNINERTIPQGRYVWGFSDDDTHNIADTGFSFDVFIQKENTLEEFKKTMYGGNFYAVAKISRRELGSSFTGSGPTPAIKSIKIDEHNAIITIEAEHYDKIEWITAGSEIIAEGPSINIDELGGKISVFVRANIIGPGGIAFTQPFGISVK